MAAEASSSLALASDPPPFTASTTQGDRLQSPGGRRDLLEDVDAVAVLLDHALEPPDLPFDPAQALQHRLLVIAVPLLDRHCSASS